MTNLLFHLGPLAGLSACTAFAASALYRGREKKFPPTLYPLSEETQKALEIIGDLLDPSDAPDLIRSIPLRDLVVLYLNSRGNRSIANAARVDRARPDCQLFLQGVETDHSAIKQLIFHALRERRIGILIHSKSEYSKKLLWTYAQQQEYLGNLAECCPHDLQQVILLRI